MADVSKRYRRGSQSLRVLEGASLQVGRGEVVCVLGTRGQGKTTLLRIAAGMESADTGRVSFEGHDLATLGDRELSRLLGRKIAWAGKNGPGMTHADARLRRDAATRRPRRARAGEPAQALAGKTGCRGACDGGARAGRGRGVRRAEWERMSDWERALVEVAQAIAGEPALLLVDDVTDALGIRETDELTTLLSSLARESKMGVLMSVSDAQATLLSDRIMTLAGGRLTEGPQSPARQRDRVPRSRAEPPRRRAWQHFLVLELRELVKHYRVGEGEPIRAVDGVSLSIETGELLALYGPSGSGKSTLLTLVAALLRPDSGTVLLDGREISALSEEDAASYRLHDLGFISQTADLLAGARVIENAALKLWLSDRRGAEERVRPLLERLGLGERLSAPLRAALDRRAPAADDRAGAVDETPAGARRRADGKPRHTAKQRSAGPAEGGL